MSVITSYETNLELPKMVSLAKILIYLGLASLMLCVPFLNKCFWVAIFLIFISGSWVQDWRVIAKDKIIISGLLLMFLFTVGMFYSQGSWNYSLRAWDKYLKIFYVLFFLPLFTHKKMRTEAVYCLLISVMISEVFTYLHYFNLLTLGFPPYKHWLFVQDIDSGFIVSFASFILLNLAITRSKLRWLFALCFLVCSIDVLFLNQERTGYLIYFALAGLFLLQRFRWKGFLTAMIIVPLLFSGLYFGSEKFSGRINQFVNNVMEYQKGNQETSIGLRLAFAEYSFKAIKNNFLIGSGTGSFEEIYRSMNGPKINNETWPAHPHNEYISILFQLGIVGLLVFLYWVFQQIHASFKLPQEEKVYLQALIVGFLLLGFCNASLLVNPAGACYATFLAVFLAAKYERRNHVQ